MLNPAFFYFLYFLLFPDRQVVRQLRFEKQVPSKKFYNENVLVNADKENVYYKVNYQLNFGINEVPFNNSTIYVVKIKPDSTLKIIPPKIGGTSFDDLKSEFESVKFLMNAGMFHENYKPVGLLIEKGKIVSPLDSTITPNFGNFYMYPNGVFVLNKSFTPKVLITDLYKSFHLNDPNVLYATQSGPILVYNGQIHPGFSSTSTNKNIRNGIGVTKNGEIIFAISQSPITFYDFALAFRELFNCPNALYLDGAISELFYNNPKKGPIFVNKTDNKKFGPVFLLQEK
jgi:uncharacterized protein YigE (DUF2233 family)